ncbi:general stress protein [Brevibacterium litoralis]|uniref:general stress protein n=1 Tax=Brevibacterium litoralis TaxID=3138935 RepID=UPI0032EC7068
MVAKPLTQLPHGEILASYPDHEAAKDAVRHLSRAGFPVTELSIVGSNVYLVEAVAGARSWGAAAWRGAVSGAWIGMLLGLGYALFGGQEQLLTATLAPTVLVCVGVGVLASLGVKALGRRQGSVVTVPNILAGSYEIVCPPHRVAEARQALARM